MIPMQKDLFLIFAILGLMCLIVQTSKVAKKWNHRIYDYVLALTSFFYICGVVYFTALRGPRVGLTGVNCDLPLPFLKAIQTGDFGVVAYRSLLNILLFVPSGYLLPQVKRIAFWKTILAGFTFSLLIETSQLVFQFGVFQLDDLIKNSIGAGLGYLLYIALNWNMNNDK